MQAKRPGSDVWEEVEIGRGFIWFDYYLKSDKKLSRNFPIYQCEIKIPIRICS